jgi:hypothetical protein
MPSGRRFQFTTRTFLTLLTVTGAVLALARWVDFPWLAVLISTLPFYSLLLLLAFVVLPPIRLALWYAGAHTLVLVPLIAWFWAVSGWDRLAPLICIVCVDLPLVPLFLGGDWIVNRFQVDLGEGGEWIVPVTALVLGGIVYGAAGYLVARFSLIGPRRIASRTS